MSIEFHFTHNHSIISHFGSDGKWKIPYDGLDGKRYRKVFKTLAEARKWAKANPLHTCETA